jgi:hypothetical protein
MGSEFGFLFQQQATPAWKAALVLVRSSEADDASANDNQI